MRKLAHLGRNPIQSIIENLLATAELRKGIEVLFSIQAFRQGAQVIAFLRAKRKIEFFSLSKVSFENAAKKKPSAEYNESLLHKRKNKNTSKHDFVAAFRVARAIKCYDKSCAEDQSNELQFP